LAFRLVSTRSSSAICLAPIRPVTTPSREEQRRLMDFGVLPGRRQLPVAIDVAIPVQAAAEAGLGIDFREVCEINFRQPSWQRPIAMTIAEKALVMRDELMRRGIGQATADEYRAHGEGDIAFELGLGDAVRLKILPIEIADAIGPQGFERPAAATDKGRHAETRHLGENVRPEHRRVPGNRCPPIVTDYDGLFLADIVEDGVGAGIGGRGGAAEAAHIWRYHAKTGRGDRRDLVPPGVGQLRPAMAEHDEGAVALFEQEHLDPVDRNRAGG
jgi:hypothetical protein